ncbi:M67 family metallopeptidase [filamentous cyanobacterium LEGE 11480]|uniref:M67 family metallopeptidase n=1 Tax=Romeriopsis navalis LEGE 11480 TaxID=2777977 RepID=A0A928VS72_9CYAN|nr:M67 family metallopeptidase [Romeriopsis navalis]MBE9031582.1 M67 family metallopeptidase [Romeriopsis navalis LEGE 11480]
MSVPLHLTKDQISQLEQHARSTYPQECCGVLVGHCTPASWQVNQIYAVANAWSTGCLPPDIETQPKNPHSPADRYWIAPADLFQIMKSSRADGLQIIGIYHSHPDHPALPSECDRRLAWPEYCYVILAISQGQVHEQRCWQLDATQQFQEVTIAIS